MLIYIGESAEEIIPNKSRPEPTATVCLSQPGQRLIHLPHPLDQRPYQRQYDRHRHRAAQQTQPRRPEIYKKVERG